MTYFFLLTGCELFISGVHFFLSVAGSRHLTLLLFTCPTSWCAWNHTESFKLILRKLIRNALGWNNLVQIIKNLSRHPYISVVRVRDLTVTSLKSPQINCVFYNQCFCISLFNWTLLQGFCCGLIIMDRKSGVKAIKTLFSHWRVLLAIMVSLNSTFSLIFQTFSTYSNVCVCYWCVTHMLKIWSVFCY